MCLPCLEKWLVRDSLLFPSHQVSLSPDGTIGRQGGASGELGKESSPRLALLSTDLVLRDESHLAIRGSDPWNFMNPGA